MLGWKAGSASTPVVSTSRARAAAAAMYPAQCVMLPTTLLLGKQDGARRIGERLRARHRRRQDLLDHAAVTPAIGAG
jgi:hypothetical protein